MVLRWEDCARHAMIEDPGFPSRTIYLERILPEIPRLLGLLDRNPGSLTYGCFDRAYWHYRTQDTPSARCQEAVLTLMLLWTLPGTPFTGQSGILTWVRAGLEFWSRIQRRDGSFNEWYPNEGSFVATAFSTYAVSEVLLQLDAEERDVVGAVTAAVARAANWIMRERETRALNQTSGAAAALYNAYLLTGDLGFERGCRTLVEDLRRAQSCEGWFPEYGGADLGYLSLTIAYLAKLLRRSNWDLVREIAEPAVMFLANFVQRDDTAGGEPGSRMTEYLIPDGFEALAERFPPAAAIRATVRRNLMRERAVGPGALDDRYLSYVGYNYLQAYQFASGETEPPQAALPHKSVFFPESGLARFVEPAYDIVVNLHRGGAFRSVFNGGNVVQDGGVVIWLRDGSRLYSGFWQPGGALTGSQHAEVSGNLIWAKEGPLDTPAFIALHGIQFAFGRGTRINRWLKQALRDRIIMPKASTKYRFSRRFEFSPKELLVHDWLSFADNASMIDRLVLNGRTSLPFVPSSKFFVSGDGLQGALILSGKELVANRGRREGIAVERAFDVDGRLAGVHIH